MDENTGKFFTIEWSIRNVSFWKSEIHGKSITSPQSSFLNFQFELFPRGLNDDERMAVNVRRDPYRQGEHLAVHICNNDHWNLLGELVFIGSDGTILCTQQVHFKNGESALKLPPGLKFEKVVAEIRKNEVLHKDQLTLRFRRKDVNDSVECMTTTIDVLDFFVKISPESFGYSDTNGTRTPVLCLKNFLNNARAGEMYLCVSKGKRDNSKLRLALKPKINFGNFSVLVRMYVLNNEDDVVRTEGNEHLFRDSTAWTFSNSLTQEEVTKETFYLVICFKIPNAVYRNCFGPLIENTSIHIGKATLKPTNIFEGHVSEELFFKQDNSVKVLTKELMCLYQDQDFSDFQLKCKNISFPVHRAILSVRSPVFKTMLSTNMREAATGCMAIVDLDPSTLGLFLTYLYTGTVDDLQGKSAIKLYYAADKYQVSSLKRKCKDFLSDNVSVSNVCDILFLADRHRDDQLTSIAHNFILMNYKKVLNSEEWKRFMKTDPSLLLETVTYFADKNPGSNVYLRKRNTKNPRKYRTFLSYKVLFLISFPIIYMFLACRKTK